jgi:hypothetical protein
MEVPYFKFFVSGLILSLVILGIISLIIWLLHKIYRHDVPYISVLNVTAAALLPFSVAFAASIILGFISVYISTFLIVAGLFLSIIFFYHGIQALAPFGQHSSFVYALTVAFLVFATSYCFLVARLFDDLFRLF